MARHGKSSRASRARDSGPWTRDSEAFGQVPTGAANERAPSPRSQVPIVRRAAIVTVVLVVAALVVAGGVYPKIREARYRSQLPALPNLARQPSALRELLEQRDRSARAAPTSANIVGALGLAYQANMFYEEADRSYAIAEELGGSAGADPDAGADPKRVGLQDQGSAYEIPGRTIARWCMRRAVIRTRRQSRSAGLSRRLPTSARPGGGLERPSSSSDDAMPR